MGPEREEGHYAGGLLVSRRMVEALETVERDIRIDKDYET